MRFDFEEKLKNELMKELDDVKPALSEKITSEPICRVAPEHKQNRVPETEDNEADRDAEHKNKTEKTPRLRKKRFWSAIASASVAAAVGLCVLLGVFLSPTVVAPPVAACGSIVMEINPSVNFAVNEEGNVVNVSALNEDADILLSDGVFYSSLIGVGAGEATSLFADRAKAAGYLTEGKTISLSVAAGNDYTAERLKTECDEAVKKYIENSDMICTLNAVVTDAGALASKLGCAADGEAETIVERINALPVYTFEIDLPQDGARLQEKYEREICHGTYRRFVEKVLLCAYEKADDLEKIYALNTEIEESEDNRAILAKDYWNIKEHYADEKWSAVTGYKEWTAEFRAKMRAMDDLLTAYEKKYDETFDSYEFDFLPKYLLYATLADDSVRQTIRDWTDVADVLFASATKLVLSCIPSDFSVVKDTLTSILLQSAPQTAEEYVAKMKEVDRLYCNFLLH